MTLGKRIKLARERLELTQAQVAEKMGVSDKAVSAWERNADKPDIDRLMPLSTLLKVSVVWLLSGTSNPPPPDLDWNVKMEALPSPARVAIRAVYESLAAQAKVEQAS